MKNLDSFIDHLHDEWIERPGSQQVTPLEGEMLRMRDLGGPALLLGILVIAVVLSCMAVIDSAFQYRRLFNEHQVLVKQSDDLQVEWSQLLLEESAWASHSRIDAQARGKLEMVVPSASDIEIVQHDK